MHVLCVLAVLRGFFFFFLLMARQIHRCPLRSACKSAATGGSIIPGQGFLLGIAPAGWQNACGGPRVSIPGLAGLACVFPQPWAAWEGHQGTKEDSRDCNPEAQTASWKVRPGVITVRAHRLQTGKPDGRMDGQAHGSRNTKPENQQATTAYLIAQGRDG